MALCEVALSDGSDLVAEEMKFGSGWNSTSTHYKSEHQKLKWHIFGDQFQKGFSSLVSKMSVM